MVKRDAVRRAKTSRYQVFVSHATQDKWLAIVLCEKIDEIGLTTFRDDRDIASGDDIPDRIRDAIEASDEMIVLLTPASVTRPWVLLEVGAAWFRGMRITAIRQHVDIEPIPDMLKSKKVIDLNEFPQYLGELKQRVGDKA
jgi:TIR domain